MYKNTSEQSTLVYPNSQLANKIMLGNEKSRKMTMFKRKTELILKSGSYTSYNSLVFCLPAYLSRTNEINYGRYLFIPEFFVFVDKYQCFSFSLNI